MISGPWLPQTEREEELLEDIFVATREAHADGVSKRRIAACLAFQAAASLDPQAEEVEPVEADSRPSVPACPECEAVPDDARGQMGTTEIKLSCGHWLDLDDYEGDERAALERLLGGER